MKYVGEVQSKNDCVGEVRRPKNKTIIKCTFSSEFLLFFLRGTKIAKNVQD